MKAAAGWACVFAVNFAVCWAVFELLDAAVRWAGAVPAPLTNQRLALAVAVGNTATSLLRRR